MVKRLSHVAIATNSIGVTSEFYKILGLEANAIETVDDQKARVAILSVGDTSIELVESTDPDSPIAKFLEKRGEGLHHISLEVDDLERQLEILKEKNIRLIDETPRIGAAGRRIAFVHPNSTGGVLVELSEVLDEAEA